MIRKSPSLTYASELLVDTPNMEKRRWVNEARDAFWLYVAEDCIVDLKVAALYPKVDLRDWVYRRADDWLAKTDAGHAFADRVAEEQRS